MSFYAISASNVTFNTANDILTIIAAASRRVKLHEVSVGGMGTASLANELAVARSTAGTTGASAPTIVPLITDMPAASSTMWTAWTTQPTLGSNIIMRLPVNSNGGVYRWVSKPGLEPEIRGAATAEQWSFRPAVGTGSISWHVIVEEI